MSTAALWDYELLKELIRPERLPAMVVDLDILAANVGRLSRVAAAHGKTIRTAAKSVRVPDLLRYILEVGSRHFRGLMCFSAQEARFLAAKGFDDLLLAYPTVQRADLEAVWELTRAGKTVALMVDEPAHLEAVEAFWNERAEEKKTSPPLRVCIEIDMSWRPYGFHVGALRSPIRSVEKFAQLLDRIAASPHAALAGVMGYEGQIAGVGDENPFAPMLNPVKKWIKRMSVKDVARKRRAVFELLRERNVQLAFFNGGGTGSIRTTSQEPWITEVAAGSGFLQSHLFDYYAANENQPAFCFALQVTRAPSRGVVTCQSGGFIASGGISPDKAPIPFRPAGLKTTKAEGCGEVQTPLILPPELRGRLRPGDPVFFRPAKAGEIAERFNEYLLVRGSQLSGRAKTYRGLGQCFY